MGTPVASERTPARITLTMSEAAAACSMSRRSFYEHVVPHLAIVRVGRMRLVRPAELDRWMREKESRAA